MSSPDDQYSPDVTGVFVRAGFSIIQPIFTWGLIENAREAADHGVRAAQAGVDVQTTEVALRVKQAYWGLVTAKTIRAFLLEVRDQVDEATERTERLIEGGFATDIDVYRSARSSASSSKAINLAERTADLAGQALATWTGQPKGTVVDPTDRPAGGLKAIPSIDLYVQNALADRPEFAQLREGIEARRRLVDVERKQGYPLFFVGILGDVAYATNRDRLDNPYVIDPLYHTAVGPVIGFRYNLDFGIRAGKVKEAEAEVQKLEALRDHATTACRSRSATRTPPWSRPSGTRRRSTSRTRTPSAGWWPPRRTPTSASATPATWPTRSSTTPGRAVSTCRRCSPTSTVSSSWPTPPAWTWPRSSGSARPSPESGPARPDRTGRMAPMRRLTFIGVLAALALAAWAPLAQAGPPTDQLKNGIDRVLSTLQDPAYKHPAKAAERRDRMRAIANEVFDWRETGKRALARHWQGRTPKEQDDFSALFAELLERSYVGKIESYSGEKIIYGQETVEGDQATVRTKLITKSGTEIPIDYRMLQEGERWRVYDVLIEGVSLVGNYRSQFNRVIQQTGFADLMLKLKTKQEELQYEDKSKSKKP